MSCSNNVKNCSYDEYKNFITDNEQESLFLECIQEFNESNFRGTILIDENTLSYGWHENELDNPNDILEKLQGYSVYGIMHINGITYFKKASGFIDDSCGLMYVPQGSKLPNEVRISQILIDKGSKGKWYFVEAKL